MTKHTTGASWLMTVVTKILDHMSFIPKPQRKFLSTLFVTILTVRGRVNFLNLSRYSAYTERTFRRQYQAAFDFPEFNRLAIARVTDAETDLLLAQDASFIPKSGTQSYGLDSFWNGCTHRNERGQEISLISIVDVARHTAFALSAHQTPPRPAPAQRQPKRPPQPRKTPPKKDGTDKSRMDFYLAHLSECLPSVPEQVRYGVFDGAFAKHGFVNGVRQTGLHVISRLRCDANLRYLYTGEQRGGRGRKREYDGKVSFTDLTRFASAGEIEPHVHLYTQIVDSPSLKLKLRVVVVVNRSKPKQPRYVVLFSTACDLSAAAIFKYYTARFQIEFLFRDAKQFAGLSDCQARDKQALHFHFNASLATVNLAKIETMVADNKPQRKVFSLSSFKQRAFNDHFLHLFISKLALEPNLIKKHPQY
ncbi:MAG: transposase, partial [Acidobacteriota bacterium]|nr:transposase [Acidobacteriota bacterium]